ncbi:MAG: phosphoribosylformylglycinamidine synthase subunit PurQ [Candidatus Aenigmatarchaeota archaeon]|nr:MAG: phosphoribosylformylglycinamidine synthase subunit PurQ [Candidatus Aenigmarchaeota archaeon]
MNRKPRVAVLTGDGINCEVEMAYAFRLAGAQADIIHLTDLFNGDRTLEPYQMLGLPGGFHAGDDLCSGKVLANQLRTKLREPLAEFVEDGKLMIGICNGFQALVRAGMLPATDGIDWKSDDPQVYQQATLAANDSGRFEDRWVTVRTPTMLEELIDTDGPVTPFTKYVRQIDLPVRHGEGKFVSSRKMMDKMWSNRQISYLYANPCSGERTAGYPCNPNGAMDDIAAISDPTGRIFGMMPHPEAYNHPTNHPDYTRWPREKRRAMKEGEGIAILRGGVEYARERLL